MEILRTISLYAEDKEMPFLLIGGHAVNAYGFSRQTGDIDLLIPKDTIESWKQLFGRLKYRAGQSDDRFARYSPPEIGQWPIDLMLVDRNSFSKMYEAATLMEVGTASVKVTSARHLSILKIHALKFFQEHRHTKDFTDLVSLLRSGKTGISEDELREMCVRYASADLFEKLKAGGALHAA